MDIQNTLDQLRQERNQIDQAISALEGLGGGSPRRGRPAKSGQAGAPRRVMSAAARAKIAAAQRARWARQKGQSPAKSSSAAAAPKRATASRKMTPAARRKLSAMMKARWAARKAKA